MIAGITILELKTFLERYKQFTAERADRRVYEFQTSFAHIKVAWETIHKLARTVEKQQTPRFNLFHLLDVARSEVKTHSALLAEFLNPEGTHGQGTLFLETFLSQCWRKEDFSDFPRIMGDIASAAWIVERGKVTAFGNIDVVIASPELKFLLAIENKIDAVEQAHQLRRYADWLERQTQYPPGRKALIYLTRDGGESMTHEDAKYYRLSYRQDLTVWLRAAWDQVTAPRLRESLAQYMEVVATL